MFEVSWDDPAKETVGQRKAKREIEHTTRSRSSGLQSRASTSSDSVSASTKLKNRPSILTLLNSNNKTFPRPASRVKAPALDNVSPKRSLYETVQDSNCIDRTDTSNLIRDRYITTSSLEHPQESPEDLTPSDEPTFTRWASHSASSSDSFSPWSSTTTADSPGTRARTRIWTRRTTKNWAGVADWEMEGENFIQPLSPTSFVMRRTEVSVAKKGEEDDSVGVVDVDVEGGRGEVAIGERRGTLGLTTVRIYSEGRGEEMGMMRRREGLRWRSPSPPLSPPTSQTLSPSHSPTRSCPSPSESHSRSRSRSLSPNMRSTSPVPSENSTLSNDYTIFDPQVAPQQHPQEYQEEPLAATISIVRRTLPRLILIDSDTEAEIEIKSPPAPLRTQPQNQHSKSYRRPRLPQQRRRGSSGASSHVEARTRNSSPILVAKPSPSTSPKLASSPASNLWTAPKNWESRGGGGSRSTTPLPSIPLPPPVPARSTRRPAWRAAEYEETSAGEIVNASVGIGDGKRGDEDYKRASLHSRCLEKGVKG